MDFDKQFPARGDVIKLVDVSDILRNESLQQGEISSIDDLSGANTEKRMPQSEIDKLVDVTEIMFGVM